MMGKIEIQFSFTAFGGEGSKNANKANIVANIAKIQILTRHSKRIFISLTYSTPPT